VIAADYAPDGKTLAVVRRANRKVGLEYPVGKVIYTTPLPGLRACFSLASKSHLWSIRCTGRPGWCPSG